VEDLNTSSTMLHHYHKKKKRKRISEWEKQVILERQNYRCAMCGKRLKPGVIHFDHKKPLALGGKPGMPSYQN